MKLRNSPERTKHNRRSVRLLDATTAEPGLMIVMQETMSCERRETAPDMENTVRGLQAAVAHVTQTEMRRFRSVLRTLTPQQQQTIEQSLQDMAYKILDPMIRSTKQTTVPDDSGKRRESMRTLRFGPPRL